MTEFPTIRQSISLLKDYFHRSYNHVYRQSLAAIDLDMAWKKEMPMFTFRNEADLSEFRIGSDADIGGYTEAFWGLTPEQTALFWGTLSTKLPPQTPGLPNIAASGYAGVQSRERPLTMLHHPRYDTTLFRYLAIRARGDERQWFVNLQADSLFPTHLWQHRLYFKTPGEWETVLIPFRNFVLTNDGYVQKRQIPLDREKIKTVGFSILRQDGPFSLEVDWIKALNTPQTFGDFDVLSPNEYIDEHGHIHVRPGPAGLHRYTPTSRPDPLGSPSGTPPRAADPNRHQPSDAELPLGGAPSSSSSTATASSSTRMLACDGSGKPSSTTPLAGASSSHPAS